MLKIQKIGVELRLISVTQISIYMSQIFVVYENIKGNNALKQSEKTITEAKKYIGANEDFAAVTETIETVKTNKQNDKIGLFDRVQFTEGSADISKYHYNYVGSNYTGLSTKETAKIIRTHLKKQFPEVKFSVTSDYNRIDIEIKSSPYNNKKLEYNAELDSRDYREYEKENNKEINAILDYCNKLLDSYNYDDSDSMTDYFCTHFYSHVSIDYDYIQTEQSEEIKADIENFRNKLIEAEKLEEERKEIEYQERLKQQEEEHKQYELRQIEEQKQTEIIYNSVESIDLSEDNQYFIIGSEFAKLNKNCTLDEYKEEVLKGEFNLENIKITRELHFNNEESLNYFSNLLLHDFTFIEGTSGSYTDDLRINSMTDYYNMTKEEQNSVEWLLQGIAVYFNNELQFVVNSEGFSYARYVGLVDNIKIEKAYNSTQILNDDELEQLKTKADTLTDISFNVITENNLINKWNNENWNEYKELIKAEFRNYNFKLTKAIIQQLDEDMEQLKVAMYKLLIEVDGIQEQFKNADLQQGQKITMYYIGEMGGMIKSRVTVDKVEFTEYAQYKDAVKVTFTPQGKKKQYYNYWYSTLLVYDGWLELPENVLYNVKNENGFVVRSSKYTSCDHKQFDDIMEYFESKGIKPIINNHKPIF